MEHQEGADRTPGTSPGPDQAAVTTRELLAVGGRRHGQMIEIAADATSFVDLLSAETYYVREFKYVRRDPANPRSLSLRTGYKALGLLHESIAMDQGVGQQWWMAIALERMFIAIGREVPVGEIIGNVPPESPNGKAGQHE